MQNTRDVLTPENLAMLQVIAESGSFAAAARQLGLVPSALTYRVRQIEDALDVLLDKADRIEDPFEQAFFVMVQLPYLQPFADINKRCSRLAANLPLFRANLCPLTFLDVPEQAYSRAMLGVYEMTRIELLRDLFVWAYERSTQEYLAIRQQLAEPDPLRLRWRDLIKSAVREVVTSPQADAMELIEQATAQASVPDAELGDLRAATPARLLAADSPPAAPDAASGPASGAAPAASPAPQQA